MEETSNRKGIRGRRKDTDKSQLMLTTPMPKLIFEMALPTIIAFIINTVYSLADTYFVSSLGTNATAAVSVNSSLDQFIMMAGSLFAIGANSYCARLLGTGDKERASSVLSTAFGLAAGAGLLITLICTPLMRPMVTLLGATETCMQYSIDYATYILLAAPFMCANFVMNQCLRAEGSAMLSMFGMGIGGIINIVLDPIFIFTLNLGVAGASIATAISKLISFIILIFPYVTGRSMLKLGVRRFHLEWPMLREIISVGSTSMFRSGLAVVAAVALNNIAGSISDSVLAGIGVSTKVMMFPMSIILGFGSGFQPVAGFSWGARRFDRVHESYRFASIVGVIGGAVMGLVVTVFARQIIGLFTEGDADMIAIGMLCIRSQAIVLPVHAWVYVVNAFCAGLGYVPGALLLSISRQGICFLPILPILSALFGATGVAITQGVADLLSVALGIPMLILVNRRIAREEHPDGAPMAADIGD